MRKVVAKLVLASVPCFSAAYETMNFDIADLSGGGQPVKEVVWGSTTLEIRACLREVFARHALPAASGIEFQISDGISYFISVTDAQGCLVWSEKHSIPSPDASGDLPSFQTLDYPRYITGLGRLKGTTEIRMGVGLKNQRFQVFYSEAEGMPFRVQQRLRRLSFDGSF